MHFKSILTKKIILWRLLSFCAGSILIDIHGVPSGCTSWNGDRKPRKVSEATEEQMVKSEGILTGLSTVKTAKSVTVASRPRMFSPMPLSTTGIAVARETWTSNWREMEFISESENCSAELFAMPSRWKSQANDGTMHQLHGVSFWIPDYHRAMLQKWTRFYIKLVAWQLNGTTFSSNGIIPTLLFLASCPGLVVSLQDRRRECLHWCQMELHVSLTFLQLHFIYIFSINRAHFLSIVRKLVLNYRRDPFLELGRHNLWGFLPTWFDPWLFPLNAYVEIFSAFMTSSVNWVQVVLSCEQSSLTKWRDQQASQCFTELIILKDFPY